jgi:hypothetical protein
VPLVELELLTLPEHPSSPTVFSGIRVTQSLAFRFICMFCRSLFVPLYFFFWSLCCLFFFNIRILITSLWYLQTLLVSCISLCYITPTCDPISSQLKRSEWKVKLKCICPEITFVQLKFHDDISFTWIVLNVQMYVFIVYHRIYILDFSAIVYTGSVTWMHLVGCPRNSS